MRIYHVSRVIPRKPEWNKDATVYSLLLNDEIWVNNILPGKARWNRARKRNEEIQPQLASFSKEHGGLEQLTGKYICCHLGKSKNGHNEISTFYSIDVQHDVGEELAKFTGELYEVPSDVSLYDFLVIKGYPKNEDGSISSKKKPNTRVIQSHNKDYLYKENDTAIEPYLPTQRTDLLTVVNVEHIFRTFYERKTVSEKIEGTDDYGSWEHLYKHKKDSGIYIESKRWNNSMKMHVKVMKEITTYLIRLGDKLSNEHNEYLTLLESK